MRCSSALVLCTLAVGQAAAGNPRHAGFHARRRAEIKRGEYDNLNVDWSKVSYDLSGVNWSSVFAKPAGATGAPNAPQPAAAAPTGAPSPPPPSKPAAANNNNNNNNNNDNNKQSSGNDQSSNSNSNSQDTNIAQGVSAVVSRLSLKSAGVNAKSSSGGQIWVGSDGKFGATVHNNAGKDTVFFCWVANGYSGMSIKENTPAISVGLKSGEKVDLSFNENVPSACAPAYEDTELAIFGGLSQTWAEFTFGLGASGAFDVSRNVNMNGNAINIKGSTCTSNMSTCYFGCKNGLTSCEAGSDYDLFNCNASNGGGGGYDVKMAGTGGGCPMGADGERVTITLS